MKIVADKNLKTLNDPAGNRVQRQVGATTRKYIVDTIGDLPVILLELDGSGNVQNKYIYANSQILARHDTSAIYFYLHDRLGSVRQVINASGDVENYYTYQPFGELFSDESQESVLSPFKYTGQYFDSEFGQYYLWARQYEPYLGIFTANDPVDGKFEEPLSLDKYLYCQNEPINRIDPSGLWWEITHREFGDYGFRRDENGNHSSFDYGKLDKDYSPFNPVYTRMHFRSREDVYPNILMAAASGNAEMFGYMMHEWQDSYVHYDNWYRWWSGGHAIHSSLWDPDDPHDSVNIENRAYERCDYTTTELEKVWFKYNIKLWMDTPTAELPTENPWYSVFIGASSPLIDY